MSTGINLVLFLLACSVSIVHSSPEIECTQDFKKLGSLGRNTFYISSTKLSWHDANDTCRAYQDTYLASIPNKETRDFLFKHNSRDHYWFGTHELRFHNWTWLNDETFTGEMTHHYTREHTKSACGLVNPENRTLGRSACSNKRAFLCVRPDADVNDLGEGDYYISNKVENLSWFQARSSCLCRGMDLAVVNGHSVDFMYTLLQESSELFWIGLQKTRYVDEKTGKMADYMPWVDGQPDDWKALEDCVMILGRSHSSYKNYNDAACSTKYAFICMWENTTTDSGYPGDQLYPHSTPDRASLSRVQPGSTGMQSSQNAPGDGPSAVKSQGVVTAAVVGTVVAVIAVVVVTLVVLKVKARSHGGGIWRFRNMKEETEQNP